MPEPKHFTIPARDLKVGDSTRGLGGGSVYGVDVKVKYVYVNLGASTPIKLEMDQLVDVVRMVETEEEKAAKQLQRTLQALDFKETSARRALVAARETMIKSLEAGERSSHWHWLDVPLAEAEVELWDAVTHVHKVHAQADTPLTRVEAIRLVKDERTRQALSFFRATSRSTSTISNLFDDLKTEALSHWMRELEWIIY